MRTNEGFLLLLLPFFPPGGFSLVRGVMYELGLLQLHFYVLYFF